MNKTTDITLESTAAVATNLINTLGQQTNKQAGWRELIQNILDLVTATFGWVNAIRVGGVRKLVFADNGPGMSRDMLESILTRLFVGVKATNGVIGNFNMGARVANAYRNKFGIVWVSKTVGGGVNAVRMYMDPVSKLYKLEGPVTVDPNKLIVQFNGTGIISLKDVPVTTGDSWTAVILLGNDAKDDTTDPDIFEYLNDKYVAYHFYIEVFGKLLQGFGRHFQAVTN